jgi:hypothetical protein
MDHILTYMTFLPLAGAAIVLCLPRDAHGLIKWVSVGATVPPLLLAIWLFLNFQGTDPPPEVECHCRREYQAGQRGPHGADWIGDAIIRRLNGPGEDGTTRRRSESQMEASLFDKPVADAPHGIEILRGAT